MLGATGTVAFWLRNQLEGCGVVWTHNTEVAPVESGDPGDPEAFSDRDQARVCATETQISVRLDQFGDPQSVSGRDHLNLKLTHGHGAEERRG
jgi:hypothetical protein